MVRRQGAFLGARPLLRAARAGDIPWRWRAVVAGVLNGAVLPRTVDAPDYYALGYHIIFDTKPLVTVRREEEPA